MVPAFDEKLVMRTVEDTAMYLPMPVQEAFVNMVNSGKTVDVVVFLQKIRLEPGLIAETVFERNKDAAESTLEVEIYDSGPSGPADRYTVVYPADENGYLEIAGMSDRPLRPDGVFMHDTMHERHLHREAIGEKVSFWDLPEEVQQAILTDVEV